MTNGLEAAMHVCEIKGRFAITKGNGSVLDRFKIRDEHGVRTATAHASIRTLRELSINDIAELATATIDDRLSSSAPADALHCL